MLNNFGPPAMVAGGTTNPCRLVRVSTAADNTGLQVTLSTQQVIGVTTDSTRRFDDSTQHAIAGDQLPLQNGMDVIVEAGAPITRGARLMADTSGRVITFVTGAGVFTQLTALESATAAGAKIKCRWVFGHSD